jgi:hypothetical protein
VPPGEHRDHHLVDHLVHTDDDLAQLAHDLVARRAQPLDGLNVNVLQALLLICLTH